MAVVSWITRDHKCLVLIHSRRAYWNVLSKSEAEILSWTWVMESMDSLHINDVLFAADSSEVVKAVTKLKDWPSLDTKIDHLVGRLASRPNWKILYEDLLANKGGCAIALSVIKDGKTQFYVARGAPRWFE